MSDAYYVGVWHRYIQIRARGRDDRSDAAGYTLVELLAAIVLISITLLGVGGEIAVDVKQQAIEKSQANAVHLADAWLEAAQVQARSATTPFDGLATLVSQANTGSRKIGDVTYTEKASITTCAEGSSPHPKSDTDPTVVGCNPVGGSTAVPNQYAIITVTWRLGDENKQITLTRNLSDTASSQDVLKNGSPLSNCPTKDNGASPSQVAGNLTISPSTAQSPASSRNPLTLLMHPSQDVTVTLSGVAGLSWPTAANPDAPKTTCIQLEWSDDNRQHYVAMHVDPADQISTPAPYGSLPTTWKATIPASQIQSTPTTSYGSCVEMKALLPPISTAMPACGAVATGANTLWLELPAPTATCSVAATNLSIALSSFITTSAVQTNIISSLLSLLGINLPIGKLDLSPLTGLINAVTGISTGSLPGVSIAGGTLNLGSNIITPSIAGTSSFWRCTITNMGLAAVGDSATASFTNCASPATQTTLTLVSTPTSPATTTTWQFQVNHAPWTSCTGSPPLAPPHNFGFTQTNNCNALSVILGCKLTGIGLSGGTTMNVTFRVSRSDGLTATGSPYTVGPIVVL
jgi:type II secretory pathway pseudopilin PulG